MCPDFMYVGPRASLPFEQQKQYNYDIGASHNPVKAFDSGLTGQGLLEGEA